MKVMRNNLHNVGYQFLAIIVLLITSAYVARALRTEGVGANVFWKIQIVKTIMTLITFMAFYTSQPGYM